MAAGNKDMFLYWFSGSGPCMKTIFVLAEKGLWKGCPNKMVDHAKNEHKSPEVLKLNPRGQMPTFKDGKVIVNESMAVCLYLEEKYGDKGTRLLPTDVGKRAAAYQRLVELTNLDNAIIPIFTYFRTTKEEERDKAQLKVMFDKAGEELTRWDVYLKGKSFLCGDQFTLPDAFLYVVMSNVNRQGGNLAKWPALKAFNEKVAKRQGAIACKPPHWKDSESPNMLKGLGE